MNRKSIVILVAGAMAMLSGCLMFYTGSEEGPFGVVAERDEPGRPKEVILQAGGRANWYVVFGPDGGGKDTHFSARPAITSPLAERRTAFRTRQNGRMTT